MSQLVKKKKMKLLKKLSILVLGLYAISCEDVIEVDLETAAPRLVIDASIDWLKNTAGTEQKIIMTTTTGYYDQTFPAASGATITVTSSRGTTFDFVEVQGTGEYICSNFQAVIGETYTLNISWNGETYTASETLIGVPIIEETIEQNDTGGFGGNEIEITYYYQDNTNQVNYYLFGIQDSNVMFPQYSVEDDENNQGSLTPVYYSNEDLAPLDTVNFRLYGISRRYFEYFKKVLVASGNDDGPFQSVPNEVRGNIVNRTNSENYTYGYFRLSEIASKEYIVR
jgi:hypothetical protein